MIVLLTVRGISVDVELLDDWNFQELKLVVRTPAEVSLAPTVLASLADNPSHRWLRDLEAMVETAMKAGWIDEAGNVRVHVEIDHQGER